MRALGFVCALAAAVVACAEVGPPPGGPVDRKPAQLTAISPESLATAVEATLPLRFEFDEEIDRRTFSRALRLVPSVELAEPRHDGLVVSVAPRLGWPDSVAIVWTLDTTLKDKHGVPLPADLSGAFTRAAALPSGAVEGRAVAAPLKTTAHIRAELWNLPAKGRRRSRWRHAQAAEDGRFRLEFLNPGDGPFDLEVFQDRNANGRRDEREATARRDSLYLPDSLLTLQLGVLNLIDLEGPVELRICAELSPDSGSVWIFAMNETQGEARSARVDSIGCVSSIALVPGRIRVGAFRDLDGDGRFGADSLGLSEPFATLLELELAPARPETLLLGDPDLRIDWAAIDSAAAAPPKSLRSEVSP